MSNSAAALLERLQQEHQNLKVQIHEMALQRYLSPEEEYELKRLRKVKLAIKDQIAALEARSAPTHP